MTQFDLDLMRKFDFEHWPRPTARDRKFFIWRVVIGPQMLSDWEPARVQEEPLPTDCRYTTTICKPKSGRSLLRLDLYEEPSRQAALPGVFSHQIGVGDLVRPADLIGEAAG